MIVVPVIKASHTDTYPGQTEGAVETSTTQTTVSCLYNFVAFTAASSTY